MTFEFKRVAIGDIAEVYDGPHATPKKTETGPIFLGISNLVNGRIDLTDAEHLSEEDYKKWTRRITPRPSDIVFSYETRLGEAAIIPEGLRCCLGRRMALIRVKDSKVNPRYLLYYYLSPEFQSLIEARTVHGSTVDRIPLIEFPSFPVRIPDIETQNKVVAALGSIDDKIDLNHQMNETLEAMARAIFQSWFIDFDPVRAKAAGQETGLPAEIGGLFPNSFEESPLGEVPRGWKVQSLLDFATLLSGGTPNTSIPEYWDGDVYWVSAKDVSQSKGVYITDTDKKITQLGVSKSNAKVLSRNTTVVTARGTVGSYALLGKDMTINQTNYGLKTKVDDGDYFLYFLVAQLINELKQNAYGTIFDTITTSTFRNTMIVLPPTNLIQCYNDYVSPFMEKILANSFEVGTLSELRDQLLPKLMSGELQVAKSLTP